ncbi:14799_t:CDS:2, partial [Racocetra persica]
ESEFKEAVKRYLKKKLPFHFAKSGKKTSSDEEEIEKKKNLIRLQSFKHAEESYSRGHKRSETEEDSQERSRKRERPPTSKR